MRRAAIALVLLWAPEASAGECAPKAEGDRARLEAQRMVERADRAKDAGEARSLYEGAAAAYESLFRTACETPRREGTAACVDACDELAFNAAQAYRGAGMGAKAIATFRSLVAYDERSAAHSPLIPRVFYEIASGYRSIGAYDLAVSWYERLAERDPKDARAPDALSDAVILRLGLGETAEARKDAERFLKTYGVSQRKKAGQIVFAIAAHHHERGEKEEARAVLTPAMRLVDDGAIDVRIQAHALLGRIAPTKEVAAVEYGKVRMLFADPASVTRQIDGEWTGEDEAIRMRRFARALVALGEATFFFAEKKKESDVDPLASPATAGVAKDAAIAKVRDWLTKKEQAIASTEAEYTKVLGIQPIPPPKWIVASAASVARMWGGLVDDLAKIPPPLGVTKKEWKGAIEPLSDGVRTSRARPTFLKCVDLSVRFQFASPEATACAAWLAAHFEKEHWRVDEIVPSLRSAAAAPPATPLR